MLWNSIAQRLRAQRISIYMIVCAADVSVGLHEGENLEVISQWSLAYIYHKCCGFHIALKC